MTVIERIHRDAIPDMTPDEFLKVVYESTHVFPCMRGRAYAKRFTSMHTLYEELLTLVDPINNRCLHLFDSEYGNYVVDCDYAQDWATWIIISIRDSRIWPTLSETLDYVTVGNFFESCCKETGWANPFRKPTHPELES